MPGLSSKGKFSCTGGASDDRRGTGEGMVRYKLGGQRYFPTASFPRPTGNPPAM